MAETLCNLGGNGGAILKSMGFVNVPSGTWVFKTGSKTITSKQNTIIPISGKESCGRDGHGGSSSTWSGMPAIDSRSINGVAFVHLNAASRTEGNGQVGCSMYHDNLYSFYPRAYDMDLTATQNGVTSATLSCWLEKK